MDLTGARELARGLLDEHGLHQWSLAFDSAKRRAGLCRYDTRTISLSRHLTALYSADEVRETVLHEIAHALAGPKARHGPAWRQVAWEIGATGHRCVAADAPTVPAPWVGMCPAGHRHERFRRPTRPMSCTRCRPGFSVDHLVHWRFHGREVDLGARYHRELADARARHRPPMLPL
ncbi:MAG TPA: SprT-like domain-containing protein [Candidatus Ruania gallistercoris]|uniref:SprT-like domain-containing protein n=1 Tax=Candidatus Ruania gallistercoris TaxID=2838746 RepID=A0A9D2ECD9_9MICO|nr:SprT-like domain-containing protein [Candidatus Ruania gallistercoris]